MSGGMTAVYLVLGLGLVAGLYYALTQITARQSRLNAELSRLERLAAEVAMSAEAILERVDERIDRLNEIAAGVEATAAAARLAVEARVEPAAEAKADKAQPKPRKRRAKQEVATQSEPKPDPKADPKPEPTVAAQAEVEPESVKSLAKYQEVRATAFALADQGKSIGEIAQELGVPRGEVQLILNLRGRKVTA